MDLTKLPEDPAASTGKDGEFSNFLLQVSKAIEPVGRLSRFQLETCLGALNEGQISKRTLSLCHALSVNASSSSAPGTNSLAFLGRFFECADPAMVRKVPLEFETLTRQFSNWAFQAGLKQSCSACGPLLLAVQKLTHEEWNQLTPAHTDFLQVCVVGKMYSLAGHFLNACTKLGAYAVPPNRKTSSRSTLALDIQKYFYFAGICYAAMSRMELARDAFLECLTLPSRTCTGVQLDAYKKWLLTSYIVNGSLNTSLPAYCSSEVQAIADESALAAYTQLKRALEKEDGGKEFLEKVFPLPEFVWSGNLGLLHQVKKKYSRHRIVKLTETYVTLGFQEISQQVPLVKDIEEELALMIQHQEIAALLDQKSRSVRFLDENDHARIGELELTLEEIGKVAKDLQTLDTRLSTGKPYLQNLVQKNSSGMSKRAMMEEEMEVMW